MEYTSNMILMESVSNEAHQQFLDLSDAKLTTEDGYVFAIHRCILASKSKYFYVAFCEVDRSRKCIRIPGIKGETLQKILSFLYTNEIQFNQDDIAEILLMADYLLLDDLVVKCEAYARYNVCSNNCLQMFTTAYYVNNKEIYCHSFRILRIYFKEIVSNEASKIEELPVDAIKQLLSCENLNGKSEDVWDLIVRWVEYDTSNRHIFVPELLMSLKATNVEESLATEIIKHSIVERNPCFKGINELKASGCLNNNIEIFRSYWNTQYNSVLESNIRHHLPSTLYFFVNIPNRREDLTFYVTHDENLNSCRKLMTCEFFPIYLASFGEWIYVVHVDLLHFLTILKFKRYNLIEKLWIEISVPREASYFQDIVEHQGFIYFFGCKSHWQNRQEFRVFEYNPNLDKWNETAPITAYSECTAVSLGNKIYLIGKVEDSEEENVLMFQEYDAIFHTWSILPFHYHNISKWWLRAYSDKLFFIGKDSSTLRYKHGSISLGAMASVYYPIQNRWVPLPDPPIENKDLEIINLNGQLILIDFLLDPFNLFGEFAAGNRIRWNDYMQQWESFKESPSLINLHKYLIYKIKDRGTIGIIADENRKFFSEFEESPFYEPCQV